MMFIVFGISGLLFLYLCVFLGYICIYIGILVLLFLVFLVNFVNKSVEGNVGFWYFDFLVWLMIFFVLIIGLII